MSAVLMRLATSWWADARDKALRPAGVGGISRAAPNRRAGDIATTRPDRRAETITESEFRLLDGNR